MSGATAQELSKLAEGAAFIGISEVKRISGMSKSTLLRRIKAKAFPAPVIADGNFTRWDLAECLEWRAAQFKARDERNAAATTQTEASA